MTTLNLQVTASSDDAHASNPSVAGVINSSLLNVGNVDGSSNSVTALRFNSVTIPKDATINSATVRMTAYSTYSTGSTISSVAKGQAADNPTTFTTASGNLSTSTRPRTTATSSAVNIASVTDGSTYDWNVTSIVQELVNRSGWTSGNSIVIFLENNSSSSSEWQEFSAYDFSSSEAGKLLIDYSTGGGSQTITANLLTNTSTIYSPTVSPQAVTVAANLLTNSNTLYNHVVSAGGTNIVPDLLTNTNTFYAPTLTPQAVTVSPSLLTNTSTIYSPQLNLNVSPNLIASTNEIYTASLGTGTVDWNVQVGDGYSDVSPKQLVRTSGNYLYTIAPDCASYPGTGTSATIRVHKSNSTGVPTGFTRKDSSNEPAAVTGSTAAIDSSDNIHIAWIARSATATSTYLRYAIFNTGTDTWGSVTTILSNLSFTDIGQGEQAVSIAIDANDKAHIVFLSTAGSGTLTNRRIYYVNNVSGSWSTPVQLDSDVTYTGNQKAWHPNIVFDASGNILVAWEKGDFNDGQNGIIYSKFYNGSWGSSVQLSVGGDNVLVGIDQSTSLLITPNGTFHATYILYSGTNSQKYIRYRYSTDSGNTWSSNNPTNQATHNPSLGWTGSKVRIIAHGTPDGSNHGENLYYFEGDGGSASWGSWTQFVTGTNYDTSVNTRWSQFHNHYPNTMDVIYWNDNYPNILFAGTEIFALDIEPGLLSNTNSVHSPTVSAGASTISPNLISSTEQVYSPTVTTGSVTVSPSLIDSVEQIHSPTISVGSVDVTPDLITNNNTFYDASLGLNLLPSVISSTENVYVPTVTPGAVSVVPDLLSNTNNIYAPTITTGVTVLPDLIESVEQVFSPTISTGAVNVAADLLTNTSTVYQPTITTGAIDIVPDLISSAETFYSPTVTTGLNIAPDLLSNTNSFYTPTITTGAVTIDVDLLTNTNDIYTPTVNPGSVIVEPDLLSNTNTIYEPVFSSGGITIVPELLTSSNVIYDIILSVGAVDITPDLLESTNQVYAPSVVQVISTDTIESAEQFFDASVGLNISTQILNSTGSVYSPTIETGAVNIETDRVESTTQFYSPWVYIGEGTTLLANLLTNTSVFYNPALVDRYGRIDRVSATTRTSEVSSTTREYEILVN